MNAIFIITIHQSDVFCFVKLDLLHFHLMAIIHAYLWVISVIHNIVKLSLQPCLNSWSRGHRFFIFCKEFHGHQNLALNCFPKYACIVMALPMWSQGRIIVHLSHSYRLLHVIHSLFIIAGEVSCTKGCLVQFSNKINRIVLTKNIFKSPM